MVERERLTELQLLFVKAKDQIEGSMLEAYTIALQYEANGAYRIDVWRAGIGKYHASTSKFQLWNLGDYLSRLPSLAGTTSPRVSAMCRS